MPDFRIRSARGSDDIAAVRDLLNARAVPDGIVLIARGINGAPLGCLVLHRQDAEAAQLAAFALAPEGRGLGIASGLIAAAADRARQLGCHALLSAAPPSPFCTRLGFRATEDGTARLSLRPDLCSRSAHAAKYR